jgi:hypothetical protein
MSRPAQPHTVSQLTYRDFDAISLIKQLYNNVGVENPYTWQSPWWLDLISPSKNSDAQTSLNFTSRQAPGRHPYTFSNFSILKSSPGRSLTVHFTMCASTHMNFDLSVCLSVNTTPPPVLKISTPGFCIKFRIHGKETLRKEIGTFLNWKPDN